MVCSFNAMHAEQNSPTVSVSIIKHEIIKMCFCIPALSFQDPFSDQTAQTFSNNKNYDVLIVPGGYEADNLRMSITSICCSHIYFFRR